MRGLKSLSVCYHSLSGSRTPSGVRGLKYARLFSHCRYKSSHPVRGAWIEIEKRINADSVENGRTPSGVRGLKSLILLGAGALVGRTPSGVRGLKFPSGVELLARKSRTPSGVRGLK